MIIFALLKHILKAFICFPSQSNAITGHNFHVIHFSEFCHLLESIIQTKVHMLSPVLAYLEGL